MLPVRELSELESLGRCYSSQQFRASPLPLRRPRRAAGGRLAVKLAAQAVSSSSRRHSAGELGFVEGTLQRSRTGFDKNDEELRSLLNRVSQLETAERPAREPGHVANNGLPLHRNGGSRGVPVFVMLPLDTVWLIDRDDGTQQSVLKREKAMEVGLRTLRKAGVAGVMVDVWWGIVERSPGVYDFSAYERLFEKVRESGLKIQAVMSFHAAGGNVGDTCKIPLPMWVLDAGADDPDIFYTDRGGFRNRECLSLGCDEVPLFDGRTPLQVYRDFIGAFADAFAHLFGDVITEVTVGLGPAGELRFPSYPEGDGRWRFPGVGEFQCYDKYMLADLKRAAEATERPEWGRAGPHDAGGYNSRACETDFFRDDGSWSSDYGRFFLTWYSGMLVQHADRVLAAASEVLGKRGRPRRVSTVVELEDGQYMYEFEPAVKLGIKLAGVHWWWRTVSHAAELTAGYYNTVYRDGYEPILEVCDRYGARVSFTCVEMRDCEHPDDAKCSPQGLLHQVIERCMRRGIPLAGENALQRYDHYAFERITESAFGKNARKGHLEQLTFLRMGDLMFDNWDAFAGFLRRMNCGGIR